MPFEFSSPARIAIIGAGISGLGAAYRLRRSNQVTVFEAAPRLGGHARTVLAGRRRETPVDTGFIVFNHPNYPNLTRLFEELSVPVKPSDMSFAASIGDGLIEYGLRDFSALTAQTRNMVRPQFWRMIADILKFNRNAVATASDPDLTLGELLNMMDLGEWFRRYYLLPISGAIWSSTPEQIESFPARALVQFFRNHALLTPKNHEWRTVEGGSVAYVDRLAAVIREAGGEIRTGAPVAAVRRGVAGVLVRARGGEWEEFDQVIFACHSDDALALLEAPTGAERAILGDLRYQSNRAILHRDPRQMPKRRSCWASWVYIAPDARPAAKIGVTYWMNNLQGLDPADPLFVTLNPARPIPDEMIYDETEFRHPVFDRAALKAQERLPGIQGENRTWYCGAYARHGFHEDGYASAIAVTDRIREEELTA